MKGDWATVGMAPQRTSRICQQGPLQSTKTPAELGGVGAARLEGFAARGDGGRRACAGTVKGPLALGRRRRTCAGGGEGPRAPGTAKGPRAPGAAKGPRAPGAEGARAQAR